MIEVLTIEQTSEWDCIIGQSRRSDFYHTHAYHAHSEKRGEGLAHLWVYREGGWMVALPLLLRPLDELPGFGELGKGWWDATSVYGYAGPVASHDNLPASVINNFQRALEKSLYERGVIALFSRLHPLISDERLIEGLGEKHPCGRTVSVDLTLQLDQQAGKVRSSDRRIIRRLRQSGFTVVHDVAKENLEAFIGLYIETMRRTGAKEMYFFDDAYFGSLCDESPEKTHLFFVYYDGIPVSGGLFFEHDGIIEYHLGGTLDAYLQNAPAKLLVDEVRLWATGRGCSMLHLGGGVGGREDSLFYFKTAFSDWRPLFAVWRWILNPGVYQASCAYKAVRDAYNGLMTGESDYFPAYRARGRLEPPLLGGR